MYHIVSFCIYQVFKVNFRLKTPCKTQEIVFQDAVSHIFQQDHRSCHQNIFEWFGCWGVCRGYPWFFFVSFPLLYFFHTFPFSLFSSSCSFSFFLFLFPFLFPFYFLSTPGLMCFPFPFSLFSSFSCSFFPFYVLSISFLFPFYFLSSPAPGLICFHMLSFPFFFVFFLLLFLFLFMFLFSFLFPFYFLSTPGLMCFPFPFSLFSSFSCSFSFSFSFFLSISFPFPFYPSARSNFLFLSHVPFPVPFHVPFFLSIIYFLSISFLAQRRG